jgi:hypothetical protein
MYAPWQSEALTRWLDAGTNSGFSEDTVRLEYPNAMCMGICVGQVGGSLRLG